MQQTQQHVLPCEPCLDKAMWKGENSLRSPMAQHALVYKCCTYVCEMLQPLLNAAVPSGTIHGTSATGPLLVKQQTPGAVQMV